MESRLRKLVLVLEKYAFLSNISPFPKGFRYEGEEWSEWSSAHFIGFDADKEQLERMFNEYQEQVAYQNKLYAEQQAQYEAEQAAYEAEQEALRAAQESAEQKALEDTAPAEEEVDVGEEAVQGEEAAASGAVAVERRQDVNSDGGFYTHEEFVEFYGGDDEWNAAPVEDTSAVGMEASGNEASTEGVEVEGGETTAAAVGEETAEPEEEPAVFDELHEVHAALCGL